MSDSYEQYLCPNCNSYHYRRTPEERECVLDKLRAEEAFDGIGTVESNSLPCARCRAIIPGFCLYTHVPGEGAVCDACMGIQRPAEDTQEVNGWTVENRGRVVNGPFGEKPPLGPALGSDETPCPGCGQPMGYHDAEGFCL
jgi:hypothetical protein